MNEHTNTGEYLTLQQLVLMTGLTDRTIRNHLRQGLLQGEKRGGSWCFRPEQVEQFICHPSVRPGILAKQNAVIYDFLLENKKQEAQMCVILDLPEADKAETAAFFCDAINQDSSLRELSFCFDGVPKVPRVILRGPARQVLSLLQGYMQK